MIDTARHSLEMLDHMARRISQHNESPSTRHTRQSRIDGHTMHLNISFVTSVICRVFLKQKSPATYSEDHEYMATRARLSFVEVMRAFLDLQPLTVIPLRSWSMIHAGISSALLLEVYGAAAQAPDSEDIRLRFINLLSNEQPCGNGSESAEVYDRPNLTASHVKALRALKNSIWKRQSRLSSAYEQPQGQFQNGPPGQGPMVTDLAGTHANIMAHEQPNQYNMQ